MTAWSATHPLIDELLHDDRDYSISFVRATGITSAPGIDARSEIAYTRHGINDTLEGMAQILVKMSEGGFEVPHIDPVKDELVQLIEDQVRLPGQLKEIQSKIFHLNEMIEKSDDQSDWAIQCAVKLESLYVTEGDLLLGVAMKDSVTKAAQLGVQFVELIDKIIVDTQNSDLDLDAVVPEEMLRMGGVPAEEPRKTVGAFIYYYVKRMAAQPLLEAEEITSESNGWMAHTSKAYVLIEPLG